MPFSVQSSTRERYAYLATEALEIMRRDMARPIEVDGVARELATSRRQLQRVLQDVTGCGFRECLRLVRMRHAAELLQEGVRVREVATRVGYRQPAQFSKAFKRVYGVSPSAVPRATAPPVVFA